ncbi:HAD family hydrolase [Naasia sp. SYSU D00057]|uniref:HAD family hydrolase n=1 Tax=Naasia sp. SYSU D00057 TaxID=2817380 RepID=UPI001B308646|nr:HAD family hydrolase [Naasia sp. SYSU D00057]
MTLRAVLFDLDDTLFAHRSAVEAAIVAHLRTTGIAVEDPELIRARWRDIEEHHYHRYLAGELTYLGQRRARAADLMTASGAPPLSDAEADEWWTAYLREYRDAWRLHDDALPCLDALTAAGQRLGIITNGELDFQTTKLDAMLLSSRMDVVVASGDVGVTKPDRRIFELACERLGVAPGKAAYVGDRLRTDAMGAAAAGLTGVWLDRRHEPLDSARAAEAEALGVVRVEGLDEVPDVLLRR